MGFDEEWGRLRTEAAGRAHEPVADPFESARAAVLERLADFRSQAALVPLDEQGGLWTAELGGLDWICAFSDEEALSRFAVARDDASREWTYRRVTGALLLDEIIPALDFPCGVALNAAGPDGAVFPPMRGIVPATAALDGEAAA
ncbi:SseB family protein [Streptomyces sp. NBC_01443]|uniref:SseB family protein n=1 Tax=Streptomyces sp. NBC_01443 TaxID=2903868 RepID=UPI00225310A9|nr:SseB family protein [Streptomyces sp. NBC_01443]MCX4627717.1 SseB family protein [Streptomyces sp. NBC_01443]